MTLLSTADFDFDLPASCIADQPAPERDGSRLMVVAGGQLTHTRFSEVLDHLPSGAVLVLNDTRVMAARLKGHKPSGGAVEVLLVQPVPAPASVIDASDSDFSEVWLGMAKGLGKSAMGTAVNFPEGLVGTLLEKREAGFVVLGFRASDGTGASVSHAMENHGELPLPPYIVAKRKSQGSKAADVRDRERYQTVFAKNKGAVAAPTAGLHFTEALLAKAKGRGVDVRTITLHVGPGTFRPVKVDDPGAHVMDAERFVIPPDTAQAVNRAKAEGRPVVAVGTTVVRTLEYAAQGGAGQIAPGEGASDLYIRPGYTFRVVTDLITNFHLPKSTLLMLVSALAGRERILAAYKEAVRLGYRFYSYGDAMLISRSCGLTETSSTSP